jgi:predicted TIM-barrel fold metal-dependent hydrolase
MTETTSQAVRAQLGHPIIDADGHFVEIGPLLGDEVLSYVEEIGGAALRDRYLTSGIVPTDTSTVLADRSLAAVRGQWSAMPSWWGWPTRNVHDRATAHLPRLLHERLDELGIDVTILYPSMSLAFLDAPDPELAAVLCRAVNRYHARVFAPYADRVLVGAIVPMHDPANAIGVLDHAVCEMGLRSVLISGYARRPLVDGSTFPYRLDTFGLDSDHDYDPFWARCVELGVAPVSHSSVQHHRVTRSISNYVYNHVGGLAAGHESLCKSLFLGGVTRRFPGLRVGFLEGGVAWACSLLADVLGHWEKRNAVAIDDLDPANLDVDALIADFARYGTPDVVADLDRLREYFGRPGARPAQVDEFAALEAEKPEDLVALFERRFYFGCEADDPLITWAFAEDVNPHGARLRPVLGSDIAHWDVQDMTHPIAEAWELVERGLLDERAFRELTFLNPARLHAGGNPDFFAGTVCEGTVAEALAQDDAP